MKMRTLLPWLVALGFALLFLATLVVSQKEPEPVTFKPAGQQTSPTPEASPSAESSENIKVARVIDGDTIEVEDPERSRRVRYIGIDTPEPGECFGEEATQKNTQLVFGKEIRLELDIEKQDKYGRTLAYVWVGDTLVNEELVQQGVATVTTYAPNVKYTDRFLAAQKEARDAARGLWSADPCPTPSTSAGSQNSSPVQGAQEGCLIKGNITGEKIYHVPGQQFYDKTKIDEGKGERWFCTEEEAVGAGWRKSKV